MAHDGYVYLDYAASTPLDPAVLAAMTPYFSSEFANPSSLHMAGQRAEAAVESARETIAGLLHASPDEIIFTSGGTESDNLAVRGSAHAAARTRGADHLLVSAVEHHAVLQTARDLARHFGFTLEILPVDGTGRVDPEEVRKRLRPSTAVVSVIYGNNEIGTINPVADIARICRERGVVFHTDAVQAAAHLAIDVDEIQVDLLSLGAHKFYGPKGVGVLYRRRDSPVQPQSTGGQQEHGVRAGTQSVPLIVGCAEALRLAQAEVGSPARTSLRDHLLAHVPEAGPNVLVTGHPVERLPNHASFAIHGVDGNLLVAALDRAGFACSTGSACKTGDPEPSEVVLALGFEPEWALGSLRVTVGRPTTTQDV
ncbi:MAG TPA: cysteine desulfurase family protein, partial [Anaerolineales bacterium]|nr:cysteine desulfurase family protein [Anaerolineales bacterium]